MRVPWIALPLALCISVSGCNFAVKHPAVTAGIAGATLGFGACGVEVGKLGTCAVVGGSAGGFLALVAAVAMWTMGGDDEDHTLYDPILPGDSEPVQAGATDGSPDGTQVDEAPKAPEPVTPSVPKEKQTPIPRLIVDPKPDSNDPKPDPKPDANDPKPDANAPKDPPPTTP